MHVKRVALVEQVVAGKRLGRHVEHDPRSRAYAYEIPDGLTSLLAVEHKRHGGIFNQGQLGSCTGNAACGAKNTEPLYHSGSSHQLWRRRLVLLDGRHVAPAPRRARRRHDPRPLMGDVVPFPSPEERSRRRAPGGTGLLTLYCSACGLARTVNPNAPSSEPCSCGGVVFTSDPRVAVPAFGPLGVVTNSWGGGTPS